LLHRLKRHPIPVVAHFDQVLAVSYALPAPVLAPLLPPGLELDVHDGWGFLTIALVQTRRLRPASAPRWLGRDFFLSGYRVFARFRDPKGRTRRGLRILRSDTDRRLMAWAGNLFTHYNYRLARVRIEERDGRLAIAVDTGGEADLDLVADLAGEAAGLPPGSPFRTVHDARRFAGPLPWTFDYEAETRSIVMIRGVRPVWEPRPVRVEVRRATFFDRPPFAAARPVLANAFHLRDVDYRWERGVRVPLAPAAAREVGS
jgi:uncharacterized protein YqjF (DUF2071 family)